MTAIEIHNTDSFNSGAFILNKSMTNSSLFDGKGLLYLTQQNDTGIKNEILKLINESNQVLKVCSFIITDKDIFEALLEKSKNSDVAIFILTQLDPSKLINTTLLTEEESKEQSQSIHLSYIKRLYDSGVHVRASTSAHAKFIISDRKIGFLMSANLTSPSLTYNVESGLYLNEKCTSKLDHLFDIIFQKGTAYRQYLSSGKKNKQLIVQNDILLKQEWLPKINDSHLRYTYENMEKNLLDEIVKIINHAQTNIFLSTYSIVGITHIQIIKESLDAAIKRNVKVNIFCRGMNYRPDHLKGCNEFSDLGCNIYGDVYNHSKGVLNESKGLIFTANIDGNHGLTNGFEVGALLDTEQHSVLLNFHEHLINTSPFIFKANPKRTELFEMYEQLELTKSISSPKFEPEITLNVKKGISIKKEELEGQPIFYCKSKEILQEQFLVAGGSCFRVNYQNGTFHINEKANTVLNIDKYLLKYQKLNIVYN